MRLSCTALLVVLTLGILQVEPATASDLTDFSFGPRVGWTRTSDSEISAPVFGVSARLRLINFLSAELAVDYRKEDGDSSEIKTVPVQLSALFYLMPYLYGVAGIGWYNVDASFSAIEEQLRTIDGTTSDAGLHLGAGLEIPLTQRLALTGELRYVFLNYELEDLDEIFDVKANYLSILAGLQIYVW